MISHEWWYSVKGGSSTFWGKDGVESTKMVWSSATKTSECNVKECVSSSDIWFEGGLKLTWVKVAFDRHRDDKEDVHG